MPARRLDELGEAVEVPPCAVVVDGDDGVVLATRRGADDDDAFWTRFCISGIGALDGVELDGASVLARIDRADGAAAYRLR